jgi:hypothetical protein
MENTYPVNSQPIKFIYAYFGKVKNFRELIKVKQEEASHESNHQM